MISGKVESELIDLSEEDQQMFLKDLGLEEPGLNSLIRTGYKALQLITYFTAGEKRSAPGPFPRARKRRRPRG